MSQIQPAMKNYDIGYQIQPDMKNCDIGYQMIGWTFRSKSFVGVNKHVRCTKAILIDIGATECYEVLYCIFISLVVYS